jgi:hypothetical protein
MTSKTDPLSALEFQTKGEGDKKEFIKLVKGGSIKMRVFTTNPTIHVNNFGKEQISFAVWNWDEDRAMILSKGPSIARQISTLHQDDDFGADITKIDIKITSTSTGSEITDVEHSINALPKAADISDLQLEALEELDKKLDTIFKGSVRAEAYNNGIKPQIFHPDDGEPLTDIDISNIPF